MQIFVLALATAERGWYVQPPHHPQKCPYPPGTGPTQKVRPNLSIEQLLAKHFIARPDVKAIQHDDGAYHPERAKFTKQDLSDHVSGKRTFGHYLLSTESRVKVICYDLDFTKTGCWIDDLDSWHDFNPREAWLDPNHPSRQWQTVQIRTLAEALASRLLHRFEIPTAILYSGNKGLHVYGFLSEPTVAAEARLLAVELLEDYGCFERVKGDHFWAHKRTDPHSGFPNIEIEVFPKQDSLDGKDLGNLLRLPLGVNRKSKQESFFLDLNCGYDQLKKADPVEVLTYMDPWRRA